MPRGVYARKGSKTNSVKAQMDRLLNVQSIPLVHETDEEIESRLRERFEVLGEMTDMAISGDARAMIVSGPAGLGKSFTVESKLNAWDPEGDNYKIVKGYVRAPGLFKLLYAHQNVGQVLVFDDADEVFLDDTAINLLKAACDTSDRRVISYITESTLIDEETAERLPKSFEFKGTIIFITNYDFDRMIDGGAKIAPHLEALVSRAHYVDLAMKNRRDYMIRIRQVIKDGLLTNRGLTELEQFEVVQFLEANQDKLRELSLRMALKIADHRRKGGDRWKVRAKIGCCRI
jgi:hypothetical protein